MATKRTKNRKVGAVLASAPGAVQRALGIDSEKGMARRLIRYAALNERVPEDLSGYERHHLRMMGRRIRAHAMRERIELTEENVDEYMESQLPIRYLGD